MLLKWSRDEGIFLGRHTRDLNLGFPIQYLFAKKSIEHRRIISGKGKLHVACHSLLVQNSQMNLYRNATAVQFYVQTSFCTDVLFILSPCTFYICPNLSNCNIGVPSFLSLLNKIEKIKHMPFLEQLLHSTCKQKSNLVHTV